MPPRRQASKRKSDTGDTSVEGADEDDAGKDRDLVAGEAYLIQWLLEFRKDGRAKAEALREQCVRQRPKGPVPLKLIN